MADGLAIQSARFAKAREVEMGVREIRRRGDGRPVPIDRFVGALEVFVQHREIEEQRGIGAAVPQPFAIRVFRLGERAALVQQPSQIDVGVQVPRVGSNRATIRIARSRRLLRFERQRALMPFEDLLPKPLRGPNERIDERFPPRQPAKELPESTFAWESE